MTDKNRLLLGTCLMLSSIVSYSVQAQETPVSEVVSERDPETGTTVQTDIIVTATRSETALQETPVAITVYDGQDLLERNITNLDALQAVDPSIQIESRTGSPIIGIRGVRSTNTTEVGNPSVSVARDGFFTNRPYTLGLSFYDLARIEVLKGPQGTLFGRNSTGGLLNIITAKPRLSTVEGYVSGTVGNYGLYGGEGAVNIPVGKTMAIRASAFGRHRNGYRELIGIEGRGGDDKSLSGRAQLFWAPSERFDALISYQHDRLRGVGDVQAIGPVGEPFTGDPTRFRAYEPTEIRADVDRVTLTANVYDLPLGGTLTYTGGYDWTEYSRVGDTSGNDPTGRFVQSRFSNDQSVETQNHEIRFATSDTGNWFFQVGAFYFREENAPITAGQILTTGPFANEFVIQFNYDVLQTSKAVFGQASYNLTPTLTATLGGRYSWDEVERVGANVLRCDIAGIPPFLYGQLGCTGTPPSQTTPANGQQESSKFTYRVGMDWEVTPNNFLYAKLDTGYKPGGFSTDPTNPNNQFGPETVTAFELGTKNRFLDDRLTLNADVFYQVLDGFQAVLPRSLGSATINAGKTNTWGAELFVAAAITPTTRIDANATILHSRFDDEIALVDDGNGALVSIAGNRLPAAPDLVLTGGLEQDASLAGGTLTFRLDGRYSSAVYYDFVNRPDTRSPAYAIGNASVTYENFPWTVGAFVNNFTDALVYARITRTAIISSQTFQFQAPRTIGAQVTYRF